MKPRMRWLLAAALVSVAGCAQTVTDVGDAAGTAQDVATADTGQADVLTGPRQRSPSSLALRDIVGLSSHPALGPSPAAVAERAIEWQAQAQLGIHRMRTDFRFASIEPQQGVFDFSQYDPLVSEAAAHGVDLLALLDATAPWATTVPNGLDSYPPKDPHDFSTFAAAVADRYKASIREYEVWNEPNNGVTFWKAAEFSGEPDKYAALFLQTLHDVHAAQPDAAIAFGAILYHFIVGSGPEFLAAALQSTPALAQAIAVFSLHPYPLYPPTHPPDFSGGDEVSLPTQLATMNGLLADAGADTATMPFWLTELGWPTTAAVSPSQQASYTVQAIVLSALCGADRLYLYTLLDDGNALAAEGVFGLMTAGDVTGTGGAPPAPKPAFVAVQTLMATVGDYHVVERTAPFEPPLDGVWQVRLAQGSKQAFIVWGGVAGMNPFLRNVPLTGAVRETRLDGTTKEGVAVAGQYTLAVGPDPVIVTQVP